MEDLGQDMVSEDRSINNELEKLDTEINNRIKWTGWDKLEEDSCTLLVVKQMKDILLLMALEIEQLNKKIVELENEDKKLRQLIHIVW